jgi:pSer/pThr/pTyr-binding forkhead associated (FHA) protein
MELDELLWPKVYVARTSLARIVSELRTVLGDSPHDSRIIRTVYKTGYAFAADVFTPIGPRRAPPVALSLTANDRVSPLALGDNIAGREPDCAVFIDATTVSRRHARITVAFGVATVEDLGSTNGTFVNGVPISAATALKDGDEIAFGKAVLTLRAVQGAPATEIITRDCGGSPAAPVSEAGAEH